MFDSPKTSWFSILFPSAVFSKGCGHVLTLEGKRIESQEKRQAQTEADAFRMGELARRGRAQVQYISSEASLPPCFWATARERGPAVMASRPEPAQPLDTQLLTA